MNKHETIAHMEELVKYASITFNKVEIEYGLKDFLKLLGLNVPEEEIDVDATSICFVYRHYRKLNPKKWHNPYILKLYLEGSFIPKRKPLPQKYKYALALLVYIDNKKLKYL